LNVFVIEHERGLILFDTGMDPAVATDPEYWPDPITRWFVDHIFRFDITPDDGLGAKLEAAGHQPSDVTMAILSHLHFDHAGGVGEIPDAELLVAPEAWNQMVHSAYPHREYVPRHRILLPGSNWKLIDFEPTEDPALAPFTEACDVFGDGSLTILPTPGHMDGSVSLLIRRADAPPILLIGDLSYAEELLLADKVPATGDKTALRESFAKVRALKAHTPELVIVASHDTTAADKLAAARSTAPAAV
jgi:glyoxylase-like metal-dependent hydrolase (beta-lactamase superfamily II)